MSDAAFLDIVQSRWPTDVKVGKLGKVRLKGKALEFLRGQTYKPDCGKCCVPIFFTARFAGDPRAYDMAHRKSRGAGASDLPSNVWALCHSCHMKEHNGR